MSLRPLSKKEQTEYDQKRIGQFIAWLDIHWEITQAQGPEVTVRPWASTGASDVERVTKVVTEAAGTQIVIPAPKVFRGFKLGGGFRILEVQEGQEGLRVKLRDVLP